MHLSQLCRGDTLTLSAEASVQNAAELMRTQHVGALALTDPQNPVRVVGVVTDRDLVVNLLAQFACNLLRGEAVGGIHVGRNHHVQGDMVPRAGAFVAGALTGFFHHGFFLFGLHLVNACREGLGQDPHTTHHHARGEAAALAQCARVVNPLRAFDFGGAFHGCFQQRLAQCGQALLGRDVCHLQLLLGRLHMGRDGTRLTPSQADGQGTAQDQGPGQTRKKGFHARLLANGWRINGCAGRVGSNTKRASPSPLGGPATRWSHRCPRPPG